MTRRNIAIFVGGMVALCLLTIVAYNLPPIHERLAWRVDNIRVSIKRFLNPPEQVVFTPQQQVEVEAIVSGTLTAMVPVATSTAAAALTEAPTASPTLAVTPTPIPARVQLSGIRHEYQKFNNCAPASLSMVLSYWGWTGTQFDTRAYLRPSHEIDDKNVNPFELVDFVDQYTELDALWRVGGNLDLLKQLVAAGFPVLIEKGLHPSHDSWLGHYQIINGYDDANGYFLVYDSFEGPPESYPVSYEVIAQFWRHFNFAYVVIYSADRAAEVFSILGRQSDPHLNFEYAAELSSMEANALSGREQFFAWFNRGENLVYLQDYTAAAQAFDTAFALYAALPEAERPWRLLWYRESPYAAYYHTGRYQDVINLANTTLFNVDKPVLEETYYWRGMSKAALGDVNGAVEDLRQAHNLNPNSTPAGAELQRLAP